MPAFADNYIHIGLRDGRALVVDPGAAKPVFDSLADAGAILDSILITHKHADHIGGLGEIVSRHPDLAVFGPRAAPGINRPLREGDTAATFAGQVVWQTIATPGHTADHLSFYCEKEQVLLSGDTLFAGGCGRLFEGDAATMRASLRKLAALPDEVRVYCGHEYTLANLRFARRGRAGQRRFARARARMRSGARARPADASFDNRNRKSDESVFARRRACRRGGGAQTRGARFGFRGRSVRRFARLERPFLVRAAALAR